jgi:hypothetical protein
MKTFQLHIDKIDHILALIRCRKANERFWGWWLKNQAMAGTNRSDVQIGQVSDIVKQFRIWRSGRDTATTPATRSKRGGQQGAHISRAGTWQCLGDLNKQSVNRAGPAPVARPLTFSVLLIPTLSGSTCRAFTLSSNNPSPWQGVFAKWRLGLCLFGGTATDVWLCKKIGTGSADLSS